MQAEGENDSVIVTVGGCIVGAEPGTGSSASFITGASGEAAADSEAGISVGARVDVGVGAVRVLS